MTFEADTTQPISPVYGPVRSWRFGRSLGVDPILAPSTCSFNCIYCQLGQIQRVTAERRIFVTAQRLAEALAAHDPEHIDVVTFSGNGEPALAANLDELIDTVKRLISRPIHILSNATLFDLPEVRVQAAGADQIVCKLDAPDDEILKRMNRPAPGVTIKRIVEGVAALRREFAGTLALQIMLMPLNAGRIEEWFPLIESIGPEVIYLNTPQRPYPMESYFAGRGDHMMEECPFETRRLTTISCEQATAIEARFREATGANVVSVYRDPD